MEKSFSVNSLVVPFHMIDCKIMNYVYLLELVSSL